jgi:predicted ATPase
LDVTDEKQSDVIGAIAVAVGFDGKRGVGNCNTENQQSNELKHVYGVVFGKSINCCLVLRAFTFFCHI